MERLFIWAPRDQLSLSHVRHVTCILSSFDRHEGHVFGEVVVPVLLKGQVGLCGFVHLLSVHEQINGDLWRVEAAHMTDKGVGFSPVSRRTAVHLNLGRRDFGQ